MTDLLDLLARLDDPAPPPAAPIAAPCQPEPAEPQPPAPICKPVDTPAPAAADAWCYRPMHLTPPDKISFRCMCGALDERPAPSLEIVACWVCHQPDGMRPTPWRPTAAELARGTTI